MLRWPFPRHRFYSTAQRRVDLNRRISSYTNTTVWIEIVVTMDAARGVHSLKCFLVCRRRSNKPPRFGTDRSTHSGSIRITFCARLSSQLVHISFCLRRRGQHTICKNIYNTTNEVKMRTFMSPSTVPYRPSYSTYVEYARFRIIKTSTLVSRFVWETVSSWPSASFPVRFSFASRHKVQPDVRRISSESYSLPIPKTAQPRLTVDTCSSPVTKVCGAYSVLMKRFAFLAKWPRDVEFRTTKCFVRFCSDVRHSKWCGAISFFGIGKLEKRFHDAGSL